MGIAFMAVPHRGSGSANYGSIVANMVKLVVPVQGQYLKTLQADNDSLTDLSFQFGHLTTEQNLQIVSVFEGQKTKMPHFWRGSVLVRPSEIHGSSFNAKDYRLSRSTQHSWALVKMNNNSASVEATIAICASFQPRTIRSIDSFHTLSRRFQ